MHSAPPVFVPVGRFLWGSRLPLAAAGLAMLLTGLLAWHSGLAPDRLLVLLGAFALTALCVWRLAPRERLPEGELGWDGQAWWFRATGGEPQAVWVRLSWDAGQAMLLRVSDIPRRGLLDRYTWLQAGELPLQWHGLRCAVHAGHAT